jgi:hypothetical protein
LSPARAACRGSRITAEGWSTQHFWSPS